MLKCGGERHLLRYQPAATEHPGLGLPVYFLWQEAKVAAWRFLRSIGRLMLQGVVDGRARYSISRVEDVTRANN